MNQTQWRPVSNVICREMNGQMVLVSPHDGKIRVLNQLGTTIWEQLSQDSCSTAELTAAIVQRYEVASEQAESDVLRFVDELATRGLVQPVVAVG